MPTVDAGAPQQPSKAWSFAVLSDLHLPNFKAKNVDKTVAALINMKVRLVVVTGDHTNGSVVDFRRYKSAEWWGAVTGALRPLRDAGIAVLPVAGNHDHYMAWHRDGYRHAFIDMDRWAKPFTINPRRGRGNAQPPYAYSVDVDGVHFTLAHVVTWAIEKDVAEWIADDLAASAKSSHRLVFGHVPLVSVIRPPNERFGKEFGPMLELGKADFYVTGHEHVFWDENFTLPAGRSLRQVTVGCSSGYYNFGISDPSKKRAKCERTVRPGAREPVRCKMPNGGDFELARGRKNRHIQHALHVFVVFTVDGDDITVTPMTIDDAGRARPFYLDKN